MRATIVSIALVVTVVVACNDDGDEPAAEPLFPEDYAASFTEARPCMPSGDHDLNNVRILVDPAARVPYEERMEPFPVGAIVLKEEYDFGDTTCTGDVKQWTVMRRLAAGSAADTLDWQWQQVDDARDVVSEDLPRCIACHTGCGVPPDGYEGTCAILQ